MDIEQSINHVREAIRELPKLYGDNLDQIERLEQERLDLMHYMELVDLNARDGFKAYKQMQDVLRKRRVLKDQNEELKHVVPVLKSMKGKLKDLDMAVGGVRKSKEGLKVRVYRCRRRNDLEMVINGSHNKGR
ncbi:hypothetical protein M3E13_15505 [Oceanobacillus kimchii]|uniref:hypothetical protein n=1 Tax=Oceanobacillus kimchii TaxID=746691 RepID=UPI0021A4572B|nr:hypothetical protein [Oceanobacillus kimchii]MCT1575671.1 hypothetical protein [Oceanobacillus kimchii]MCT2137302.1 hypothetical protein [Oceanobacillus kimchii]